MNIFFLADNLTHNASFACDQHIIKQILENAQMMSTALRYYGFEPPYKSTHHNHPCNVWLREQFVNFRYLYWLTFEYNMEYRIRYKKDCNHKAFDQIHQYIVSLGGFNPIIEAYGDRIRGMDGTIPSTFQIISRPPKCMPSEYKTEDTSTEFGPVSFFTDVIDSYRNYYLGEKLGFATYNNTIVPSFVQQRFVRDRITFPEGKLKRQLEIIHSNIEDGQ